MAAVLALDDAVVEQICVDTPGIVVAATIIVRGNWSSLARSMRSTRLAKA